jgi:hypothetical protein
MWWWWIISSVANRKRSDFSFSERHLTYWANGLAIWPTRLLFSKNFPNITTRRFCKNQYAEII